MFPVHVRQMPQESPLAIEPEASQRKISQVVGVNTPAVEHEATPGVANPITQAGWQVAPKANVVVQLPAAPLVGGTEASHEGTTTVTVKSV